MKEQKLHDINFLLRIVKLYLQKDMSPEVKQTYQTLLNLKSQLLNNS
jgi:hypothetical protein